jgi:hypothetical protein
MLLPVAALLLACGKTAPEKNTHSGKAKTPEAVTNLKRIYVGASAYYLEGSLAGSPPQFPRSPATSPQPPTGSCCSFPGRKCPPNPALWTDPTWRALKFSMDHEHYYSYHFVSSGTGATAQFSVKAFGDLDCDGVYSTFEMVGAIQADGSVTSATGVYREQELE